MLFASNDLIVQEGGSTTYATGQGQNQTAGRRRRRRSTKGTRRRRRKSRRH